MPYVNIRITREGATAEQKAALISGVTQLLQETLGKNPATTVVVIDERQRVVLMNKAAENLWAADRQTLIGRKAPKVMVPAALRRQRASTGATASACRVTAIRCPPRRAPPACRHRAQCANSRAGRSGQCRDSQSAVSRRPR
mgnify:CR=1 FL=1